ncbi:hypothetical protein BDA96_08G054500 [Sorghum bicolor]|uniref:DUF6598 domain-containing protein n=1 Tax=Sorghum bicolor TaxID=4558 RepID=A0A921QE97_SORBI|nr:hypothetical protein BDA96_08G054500 [Sorghum bicolor]
MASGGGGGGGGVSVAPGGSGLGYDVGEVWGDLEPFFFDEAEAVADHERRMRREEEEAQKAAQRLQDAIARKSANKAALAKISDYDPKQDGKYFNRFHFADFSKFDLDEESPLGPMRYTNIIYNKGDEHWKSAAVNILSVKIASLDVGFPIDVYGTVIFRDNIDYKCVYLFHREKDNCQPIHSSVSRIRNSLAYIWRNTQCSYLSAVNFYFSYCYL